MNDEEKVEEKKNFEDETIIYRMSNEIENAIYGSEDNIVKKESENNRNNFEYSSDKNKLKYIIVAVAIILVIIGIVVVSSNGKNGNTLGIGQTVESKQPKLDMSKSWVYDAKYGEDANEKKKNNQYSTKKDIVLPYININSEDAEKVNKEIKNVFEKLYSDFGVDNIVYSTEYNTYENNNILSIVFVTKEIVINGGATELECYTYNFDLTTLKLAKIEDLSKVCGFTSANEIETEIKKWESKQKEYIVNNPAMVAATFEGVEADKYFIDEKGKLNFIYTTLAGGKAYIFTVIEHGKEIKDMYESNNIEHVEQLSKEDIDNSKKINKDKAFVYNSNYSDTVQEKSINGNSSKKDLVIPYININSNDVDGINTQIKSTFTELYNKYGNNNMVYSSKYKTYTNENVLSVVFETYSTIINGGGTQIDCFVYNIDLDTLKEVSKDRLCSICGFKSASEVTNKLVDWEDEQKELIRENPDKFAATFDGVEKGKYFIGENGKLNFIYVTEAGGKGYNKAVVEPNKDINIKLVTEDSVQK